VPSKEIKLQHRKYFGADKKTQYIQHRINVPDGLIQKLGWENEDEINISIESRNGKKRMILKIRH